MRIAAMQQWHRRLQKRSSLLGAQRPDPVTDLENHLIMNESETSPLTDAGISDSGAEARPARRGRGNDVAQLVVISWRDIPAQVNAQKGRERQQVILGAKFQRAIDRAKRKARIYTAHEDITQWKRETRPCTDDLAGESLRLAAEIEEKYTKEHLGKLGFLGGWEPENKPADEVLDHEGEEDPEDDPELAEDNQFSDWGTWSSKTNPSDTPDPAGDSS
jgi:Virulence factor